MDYLSIAMSPILLKKMDFQIQKDHMTKYQTKYFNGTKLFQTYPA